MPNDFDVGIFPKKIVNIFSILKWHERVRKIPCNYGFEPGGHSYKIPQKLSSDFYIGKPEDPEHEVESVPQLSSCLKSYFTFESYVNSLKWVCFFRTTFLSRRLTHSHFPVQP